MTISDRYLDALEQGLRALADSNPSGMLIVAGGRIVRANEPALTVLRCGRTELLGRPMADLFPEPAREREKERLDRALSSGQAEVRSTELVRPDGSRARVETACFAGIWESAPAVVIRVTDRGEVAQTTGDRQRILVVDDEVVIGTVVRRILREHEVVHVTSGEQAMALIAREEFDAILCDVMMPGMSGVDLFEAVGREKPLLRKRFVFVTGGAFTKRAREFLATVPNPRIDKPFEAAAIRQAIYALTSEHVH